MEIQWVDWIGFWLMHTGLITQRTLGKYAMNILLGIIAWGDISQVNLGTEEHQIG